MQLTLIMILRCAWNYHHKFKWIWYCWYWTVQWRWRSSYWLFTFISHLWYVLSRSYLHSRYIYTSYTKHSTENKFLSLQFDHHDYDLMTTILSSAITGSQCSDGEVRLTGGGSGIVEICIRGYWGTVCSFSIAVEASIVCSALGYSSTGSFDKNWFRCNISQQLH